ncbi:MAG: hypothetical protein OEN23_07170 [Paracoccaceae bacterium]|nr:hypothetical protein [Paracoccaceae bacterium]
MTLGVIGWAHAAYASQGGFIQLPQAFAQDHLQVDAHVPVAGPASGAQTWGEFDAAAQAIPAATRAQSASGTFPRKVIVLAPVPGQIGARYSDLVTTGSGAFGIVAEEAAAAGAYGNAYGTGETRAFADPAAAAPYSNGTNASRSGALVIAAGSTDAAKPSQEQKPESDQSDEGATDPKEKKPEFSGSAAQASPDLDANEEKDVISNGWK